MSPTTSSGTSSTRPVASGASWTDIGRSMGVTKQAAQQRSVPKVPAVTLDPDEGFSRFTPRARNVVAAAHDEARTARSEHVTPAHLVLGLLAEPEAIAGRVLADAGVSADAAARRRRRGAPPAVPVAARGRPLRRGRPRRRCS